MKHFIFFIAILSVTTTVYVFSAREISLVEPPVKLFTEHETSATNTLTKNSEYEENEARNEQENVTAQTLTPSYLFEDQFATSESIEETGEQGRFEHPNWWLNSGAYFHIEKGIGRTIYGRLPADNPWVARYEASAERTDNGRRPQNIFRLLTNKEYTDSVIEMRFRLTDTDTTNSIQRDAPNGVLLFGRYTDQDNLYYAGVRVDGNLVIKRKHEGDYVTLALKKTLEGTYDKEERPNLIPNNQWIQMRTTYRNVDNNFVRILLEIDIDDDGLYDDTLEVLDDSNHPRIDPGFAGIRTDFMDVVFDFYTIREI